MDHFPVDEAASASGRPHIAFCISGQIRDEHVAFPAIAKLAFELDATVILSVWRRRGTKTGGIINQYQADRMFGQEFTAALPGSLLDNRAFDTAIPAFEEQLAGLASPVEEQELRAWFPAAIIDIEDEILDLSFNDVHVLDKNSKRMLYKIWRCNEIKSLIERQRGCRFDLVVRFRPDVVPALDDFRVAKILSDHPDETIYIPGYDETRRWADDILAVSSSEIADCYASLFGRTVLSGMPPWTISHTEIAEHLIKRGITIRPIAIKHGIIEDFAARQPMNRALFLQCLSDQRYNEAFFPRPTTWRAVHAIATAADMAAGNAPHGAIAEQLAQIDLLQEDVEFLARFCELFSFSCARAEDWRSLYVSLLVGTIAEMQIASPCRGCRAGWRNLPDPPPASAWTLSPARRRCRRHWRAHPYPRLRTPW